MARDVPAVFALVTDASKSDVERLITSPMWAAEWKHDGDRRLIVKHGSQVFGYTREGNEVALPAECVAVALLSSHDYTLDGEMMPGGMFHAFDVLRCDGEAIAGDNGARREILQSVSPFRLVRRAIGADAKRELLADVQAMDGEGVVFKRINSPYTVGRSGDWMRWKFYQSDEFTVGAVNIARCSFEVLKDGQSFGRVACGINRLPKTGEKVRVRYDRITAKGKLLRASLSS
jgi:bifunctional non-homologous end joining protein LigD